MGKDNEKLGKQTESVKMMRKGCAFSALCVADISLLTGAIWTQFSGDKQMVYPPAKSSIRSSLQSYGFVGLLCIMLTVIKTVCTYA